MHLDLTILRSRVALRIFGLFVVSALFPVLILALLAQGFLETQQERMGRRQVRAAAKEYALTLFERLDLAQGDLAVLRGRAGEARQVRRLFEDLLQRRFRALMLVDGQGAVQQRVGEVFVAPVPLDRLEGLVQPNPAALLALADDGGGALIIARRLSGGGAVSWILGLLDPGYLWGRDEERDQSVSLCVLDASGHPLFCPDPGLRGQVAGQVGPVRPQERLVESWSLFIGARFQTTHWRILAAARTTMNPEPLFGFQSILLKVSLLTLLVVTLLSVYLIRKSFQPLEALMAGIRALSQNDFSAPVRVGAANELGTIADVFNRMAGRIQRQLRRFSALASIDHAILARLERNEIVMAILHGASASLDCDLVAVAIGEGKADVFRMYETAGGEDGGLRHRELRLGKKVLTHLQQGLVQAETRDFPDLLEPLRLSGVGRFLLLPVNLEGRLAALFLCGFRVDRVSRPEVEAEAGEFADRLAVGLADALREERLRYLAYHDALTDLPNRLLLMDRLTQALARAGREGDGVAVLYVDLDRFKSVNDSLGHEVGDVLLREMARRLHHSVRGGDTVARLGGDEFVVVANLHGEEDTGRAAVAVAEQILEAVAVADVYQGHEIRLSASVGIALSPADGTDPDSLLKNADAAMYHAKREGRNNCQFYSRELNARALSRLDLAAALHRALELGELRLFFQPKLHLGSRRVVGVEALLRWRHPQRGLLMPDEFVDLAEETGLIIELGRWALLQACDRVATWRRTGGEALAVSVNVSPRQFAQTGLVELVQEALATSGLPPASLELEITEGAMIQNPERTLEMLHALRNMGIRVSIDDFGTGYSSLTYLKRFPLDVLKIDKSFVRHMQSDSTDYAIVKSVVVLAHSRGLEVVAEGVETREQLQMLAELECDLVQGFLCSPPVGEDRFQILLEHGVCAGLEAGGG